nr:hypothetical protein BaRGS_019982 [Batillaria attramentaria]
MEVGGYVGTVGSSAAGVGPPFVEMIPASLVADATRVFTFDTSNGRLTTKAALDRESTPGGYNFAVSTQSKPIIVTVKLQDVNDNSPSFSPSSVTLEFSEQAPVMSKKPLGSVTDPDLGNYTTQSCEIVSGNVDDAFMLQLKVNAPDIILDLIVNRQLDYEERSTYNLIIRARDGGGRTGEMTVNVNILDQNDNQPIFNTSHYKVKIAENVTIGTRVLDVQATDIDSGENGRIRYSIDSKTDPEGHFSIDPVSGVVTVSKPLDYETQPMFRLTLEATDHGPSPLEGNAALDITLININEKPATIRLVFLQGADRQGHIPENTQAGTPVARISIDDPDIAGDIDTNVTVELHGGDDVFELQFTDDVLSLVVVNTPPDREQKSFYELTVTATDSGNPPLEAHETFTVYIDDVNDNAPKFTRDPYRAEVQEAAEIGTSVLRVNATDPDTGDNARIVYSIQASSNPEAGWFDIDSSTGVITTRSAIDCELNSQPQFVVIARDNGEPQLSGSTTVLITVRDVNDKQPEFEISFYNTIVEEDATVGDCLITFVPFIL